jgi:hypothetical protein
LDGRVTLGLAFGIAVALLVVLDRLLLLVVQRVAAGRVRTWLGTTERPSVRVRGFPILVDLARQRLRRVEVTARGVDGQGLRVQELRAQARGVTLRGGVRSLAGSGLISYQALSAAAPVTVTYGGNGTLRVSAGVSVLSAAGTARPHLSGNVLSLHPTHVSTPLLGTIRVERLPAISYRLRELPHGLDIDLNPTERGLAFTFDGTGLVVPGAPGP